MLRLAFLSLVFVLPFPGTAQQRQDPRDTVIESLRDLGISALPNREQVTLVSDAAQGVPDLEHSRYDVTLRAWLIELRCNPPRHCVPTVAMLNIADPQLLARALVKRRGPVLVRAGEHRSLLSDFGTLRLTEPVVCLQSGRAGQTIRVRVTETKTLKLASITDSGELRLRVSR